MVATFWGRPFSPINSSGPAFLAQTSATSQLYALQSTALNRYWRQPSNRAIRVASQGTTDFYLALGSSNIVAETSSATLILGGSIEVFFVAPAVTHIAVCCSTGQLDVPANITLGLGF